MKRALSTTTRFVLIAVGAAGFAISTAAWREHKSVTTTKTLATFWWNNGSCHGYPDVIQYWEVFRDEYGNLIEYRDAGVTNGTDSCAQSHPATFYNNANYLDCGGCDIEQAGAVQGNPNGTATEHP